MSRTANKRERLFLFQTSVMKSLQSAVTDAAASLGLGEGDAAIYNQPAWAEKRAEYKEYRDIYDGVEWEETTGQRSKATGAKVLRYPLQINPAAKLCRVHRALMFGMRTERASRLPVNTVFGVDVNDGPREAMVHYQEFINDTWRASDGLAMMEEAGLLLQIYGGHFFKVSWEFWNQQLPHRIAVRSLKSPAWCLPVWDAYDEWALLECYIGYYITPKNAKLKYGVQVGEEIQQVLYLEHWTRDSWKITVHDIVPVMRWQKEKYRLEGKNPWGLVPVVYIPHERDGHFYGRSLVKNLLGLSRELNARMADKGDAVRDTAHRMLFARNTRTKGSMVGRPLIIQNEVVGYAIDIGDAPPLQGAREPDLRAIENRGVPESIADFAGELWNEIRNMTDVAPVTMGDDDIGAGRITGPVSAFRMFPSISHTMTERANFSVGLNYVARIAGVIAEERERSGEYGKLGVAPPGITPDMLQLQSRQTWEPMVPIEKLQRVQELNARLSVGGISLHSYLDELGTDDIEGEEERIWDDRRKDLEIQAAVGAKTQRSQKKEKGIQGSPMISTPGKE